MSPKPSPPDFCERGDTVMLGTREPEKLAAWKASAGANASVGSTARTAEFGEIIVLATNGLATLEVIEAAGEGAFADKIVIDATNPIRKATKAPTSPSASTTHSANASKTKYAAPTSSKPSTPSARQKW